MWLILTNYAECSLEDDCIYGETGGIAIALDVCLCSRASHDKTCQFWGCTGESGNTIRLLQWDNACWSGNPTSNQTIDASFLFGDVHCSSTASTDCTIIIRTYQTIQDSDEDCQTEYDDFSDNAYIEGYCYVSESSTYSYNVDCDGVATVYTESDDCTTDTTVASTVTIDEIDECIDNGDEGKQMSQLRCACGTCDEYSGTTVRYIPQRWILLFLCLFLFFVFFA